MILTKVVAIVLMVSAAIDAQKQPAEIRLKLVDPWSGKPVARQPVILFETKEKIDAPLQNSQILKETMAKTGPDGVAIFVLGEHRPEWLTFSFGGLRGCPPRKGDPPPPPDSFYPEEIINSGVIVPDYCVPKNWHGKFRWQDVKATPGEIIYFGSRPFFQW